MYIYLYTPILVWAVTIESHADRNMLNTRAASDVSVFICCPPSAFPRGPSTCDVIVAGLTQGCLVINTSPVCQLIVTNMPERTSDVTACDTAGVVLFSQQAFVPAPISQPQDADLCCRWLSCSFVCCSRVHR